VDASFDKIDHRALLTKVNSSPSVQRQIKAWLKSGVLDGENLFPTLAGVMQGGTISPLLANIALHGLETTIVQSSPRGKGLTPPIVVRYADDFVILNANRQVVDHCSEVARSWLIPLGLELKASKTRIAHTLQKVDSIAGFDFLGFNVRQYAVGRTHSGRTRGKLLGFKTLIKPSRKSIEKHVDSLRKIIASHRASSQELLIYALNPVIRGWAAYHSSVASSDVFHRLDYSLFQMLLAWATHRHPNKGKRWCYRRYWHRIDNGPIVFQTPDRHLQLRPHSSTPLRRFVKVQGTRSPFDGDWIYWSSRSGRSLEVSPRVAQLLRKQRGRCLQCNLFFRDGDDLALAYILPFATRGKDARYNLMLIHRRCHQHCADHSARLTRYP